MEYFSFSRTPVFSKRTKRKIKQRPCTGYITEITPKSPSSCVHRSHIRYGFRTGAKDIRCSVNTHPYHAENCHHSYVWIPWVPEAFHARSPVSVSLKKWPARKASPLVSSAFGRQNEAPPRTRETTSRTQGNVWAESPFRQMKSEKEKSKVKNLAKTREITFSTKCQPLKSATPKTCVVLWGNNVYFFRFLLRHQLEALV